ncbi:DUF4468 domain-containing protein [Chryseobacterium lathyri]|uniref:DUF4468 domain-containing protein n=1 Tax=Chryseobacterium lathyri TaxID=395933 RepID=UPI001CC16A3E|nr:DUF4468 domain-containing protein [Chryseobacterium lathyri]
MKKTLIFFAFILTTILFSQELKYEEVVKVDSTVAKDELYNRARSWIANTYKSEKDVMSIEDKALGEISGNGSIRYDPNKFYFGADCARGYITYKINLYIKDGRFKYVLHSFIHEGTRCEGGGITSCGVLTNDLEAPEDKCPNKGWREIKGLTNSRIESLVSDLKEAMNKKYEGSNDW